MRLLCIDKKGIRLRTSEDLTQRQQAGYSGPPPHTHTLKCAPQSLRSDPRSAHSKTPGGSQFHREHGDVTHRQDVERRGPRGLHLIGP